MRAGSRNIQPCGERWAFAEAVLRQLKPTPPVVTAGSNYSQRRRPRSLRHALSSTRSSSQWPSHAIHCLFLAWSRPPAQRGMACSTCLHSPRASKLVRCPECQPQAPFTVTVSPLPMQGASWNTVLPSAPVHLLMANAGPARAMPRDTNSTDRIIHFLRRQCYRLLFQFVCTSTGDRQTKEDGTELGFFAGAAGKKKRRRNTKEILDEKYLQHLTAPRPKAQAAPASNREMRPQEARRLQALRASSRAASRPPVPPGRQPAAVCESVGKPCGMGPGIRPRA